MTIDIMIEWQKRYMGLIISKEKRKAMGPTSILLGLRFNLERESWYYWIVIQFLDALCSQIYGKNLHINFNF